MAADLGRRLSKLFTLFHYFDMRFSNTFWGWGGEDDEMQNRLERLGIKFISPEKGSLRDLEDMDINEKMAFLRQNRDWKCMVKWELLEEHEKTWKTNGLSDLRYTVLQQTPLDEKKKSTKVSVDVKLNGDHWGNDKAGIDYVG
jgi:N-terminal domain of galactosyltransferase